MKFKDFKYKLNTEYRDAAPDRLEELKATPIIKSATPSQPVRSAFSKRNRIMVAMSSVLIIAIVVVVLTSLNGGNVDNPYNANASLVVMDVNPGVRLIVDSDGKVTAVSAVNEDAQILLSGCDYSNSVIGHSADDGIKYLLTECARLGYIDVTATDNVIRLAIYGEDTSSLGDLDEDVNELFMERGWYAVAFTQPISNEQLLAIAGEYDSTVTDAATALELLASGHSYIDDVRAQLSEEDADDIAEQYKLDVILAYLDYLEVRSDYIAKLNELNDELNAINLINPYDDAFYYINLNITPSDAEAAEIFTEFVKQWNAYQTLYGESDMLAFTATTVLFENLDIASIRALVNSAWASLTIIDAQLTVIRQYLPVEVQEWLDGLLESIPTNVDEYVEDMSSIFELKFEARAQAATVEFSVERQPISNEAYAEYLSQLVGNGSLEEIFEEKRK